jgi:hypothetical protein
VQSQDIVRTGSGRVGDERGRDLEGGDDRGEDGVHGFFLCVFFDTGVHRSRLPEQENGFVSLIRFSQRQTVYRLFTSSGKNTEAPCKLMIDRTSAFTICVHPKKHKKMCVMFI